jgi:hypothetical protein
LELQVGEKSRRILVSVQGLTKRLGVESTKPKPAEEEGTPPAMTGSVPGKDGVGKQPGSPAPRKGVRGGPPGTKSGK